MNLGFLYVAEYERVTVWDSYLTTTERVRAVTGVMPSGKTPVQGWWNYDLKLAGARMDQRLEGDIRGESCGLLTSVLWLKPAIFRLQV